MKFNRYWFKPRRFGYGAAPCTWEGWTLVIVFVAYVLFLSFLISENENNGMYFFYLFVSAVVLIIISKKKTEGEWKWSWG